MSESGTYRYPIRRVVGHWTTSEGVLVEQLECGHDYTRTFYGDENTRNRHCRQCAPKPVRTCARCDTPLRSNQMRYCSWACRDNRTSAP